MYYIYIYKFIQEIVKYSIIENYLEINQRNMVHKGQTTHMDRANSVIQTLKLLKQIKEMREFPNLK